MRVQSIFYLIELTQKSLSRLVCGSLDVKGIEILLVLYSAGDICNDLLEVALLRLIHFFLMLDLKVEQDAMIDLALIPCPLIIVEVLDRRGLEERIVVTYKNTCD